MSHHNGSPTRRGRRFAIGGLGGSVVPVFLLAALWLGPEASAVPLAGTISFEESLDADGTQFDSWDIVTTQYADGYGITFAKIGTNAAEPTIFDGVLPNYYPPHSGTRILSNWSDYGQADAAGCLRISFDASASGLGSGLSMVNGWVTVASNAGDPEASLTMEAFGLSGALIDSVTVMRNLGSSSFFELRGDRDIASVVFTHSEGPTDYQWALDDLGYSVVPEPVTLVLLGVGCAAVGSWRGGKGRAGPRGQRLA